MDPSGPGGHNVMADVYDGGPCGRQPKVYPTKWYTLDLYCEDSEEVLCDCNMWRFWPKVAISGQFLKEKIVGSPVCLYLVRIHKETLTSNHSHSCKLKVWNMYTLIYLLRDCLCLSNGHSKRVQNGQLGLFCVKVLPLPVWVSSHSPSTRRFRWTGNCRVCRCECVGLFLFPLVAPTTHNHEREKQV